ncbi:TetR/AcrR family transcriptional regulator [Actinoplanes couchii]|uniref:TetR family transcriptional regulator n=1 Tax=Actinoplanes couchii TaxID=403638 RepID=A0ABQ3XPL7_9ACTN|nr:TetR/AcrR family transcriptional regulator [Actinoplanes couchii]MDR6319080.1 AcrR family transcriptional regulator [Actinoplanes couchii]GID60423.1 TetR family transcriptional regulator [Actinoplanes couchii]
MPRTDARGGPQTRARISQIATRLFLEHGFGAVTVADVAREAGVSTVTVFKHFPRKEDLLLDRAEDAVQMLRSAVRDRPAGTDVLDSLQAMLLRLTDDRHGLSGTAAESAPFFRTVAGSAPLIARAREIAADLQHQLADELERDPGFDGDSTLLAAFFISGYTTVLTDNARRLIAGEPSTEVVRNHRQRLEQLIRLLRGGVGETAAV